MLVILVCCMVASAGRYLVQALSIGSSARPVFLLFVLVLPVLLLIVVNGLRQAIVWIQQRKRS